MGDSLTKTGINLSKYLTQILIDAHSYPSIATFWTSLEDEDFDRLHLKRIRE